MQGSLACSPCTPCPCRRPAARPSTGWTEHRQTTTSTRCRSSSASPTRCAPAESTHALGSLLTRLNLRRQVWKARLSAYTEIASLASKMADDADPLFRQHYTSGQCVRDWVRDANAVAQEKGVEAACAIVEFGGKAAAR